MMGLMILRVWTQVLKMGFGLLGLLSTYFLRLSGGVGLDCEAEVGIKERGGVTKEGRREQLLRNLSRCRLASHSVHPVQRLQLCGDCIH